MKNKFFITLFLSVFLLIPFVSQAETLATKLQGKILLQVEGNGEAWYLNPSDQEKYYLGRPADAFNLMRELGLGISDQDFNSFGEYAPSRLAGRILLRVEAHGEAYYVNPVDLKMHFLGRPADAFSVMRNLGLGISNNNLNMIQTKLGYDISDSMPEEEEQEDTAEVEEETIKEEDEEEVIEEIDTATSTEELVDETATSTEEVIEEKPLPVCEFTAEYFDNDKLFGYPKLTQTEEEINYEWWTGKPIGFNYSNEFSVRWTSDCYFDADEYNFIATFDDGMRVYIDGELMLDSWVKSFEEQTIEFTKELEEGEHEIIVEYFEYKLRATAKFAWERL
jgi:hypothetical protein